MSTSKKTQNEIGSKKKTWKKPRIVYKQTLEARASACSFFGVGTGKSTTGGLPPPNGNCGSDYLFS